MAKKRSTELDELLEEILTDAYGDEEQLWALLQALDDNVAVPCSATIADAQVKVTKFDYDGNSRRGLTAKITLPDGSRRVVSAADIVLADLSGQKYINAYRQWMGVAPVAAAKSVKPLAGPSLSASVDVIVLYVSDGLVRCKVLSSGELITLRVGRSWHAVPGEIATIKPSKQQTHGSPYLSASVKSTRLDVKALGLTPLGLEPEGQWDPAEHYWGEPGDPIEPWAKKIIRRGKRPRFEMEQVLPGADPEDMSDPVIESTDLKNAGDFTGAYDLLMTLCREDLRCLDAHAHLGNLYFDKMPRLAIRHYEVGVRIGELSLPDGFNGVLPWGLIDNRPFLRCLNGYGICLWRLERFEESAAVFDRMLWMNPTDNQGIRFLIDDVRDRRVWTPED